MSTVIAIVYSEKEIADEVFHTVNRLQSMGLIDLIDACVAEKKEDRVKLHQTYNLPLLGAANGIFLGALVGVFFLMPGIGALAGAVAGTIGGAFADVGLSDRFMKSLASETKVGDSVLFLYVRDAEVEKSISEIALHGGKILYTSLSIDQENQLKELFKKASVTKPDDHLFL